MHYILKKSTQTKSFKIYFNTCLLIKHTNWIIEYLFDDRLLVQWNLDLRKPDLRKNLDLRKIVGTTDFLVHKLFDLKKIF